MSATMLIHQVSSVQLGETTKCQSSDGSEYFTRAIIVLDKKGYEHHFTLFGENKTNLTIGD